MSRAGQFAEVDPSDQQRAEVKSVQQPIVEWPDRLNVAKGLADQAGNLTQ